METISNNKTLDLSSAVNFNDAFKKARNFYGANHIFEYQGRKYGTNLAGEEFKPSDEILREAGLLKPSVKKRLDEQNEKLNNPYLNKKTVKLEPDKYINWNEVKQKQKEINKADNASIIINYKKKNNDGKNFVIVDKQKGLMHIYEPSGNLLYSSAIDLGANVGDAQTVTKIIDSNKDGKIDKKEAQTGKADFSKGNKSTGAGKFYISNIDNKGYEGLPLLNMMNEQQYNDFKKTGKINQVATSFHKGYVKDDNSRVSNGCIRCNKTTLDNLVKNLQNSSEVYILPEDKGNKFVYENGKLNFKVNSGKDYNNYKDSHNEVQKGQGINRTQNTLNYIPIKAVVKPDFLSGSLDVRQRQIADKFAKSLEENKQKIMQIAKINGDVYNDVAKIAFGILGVESNYGSENTPIGNFARAINKYINPSTSSSPDYKSKFTTYGANENFRSVGLTQIRFSFLNEKEKEVLKKLGITGNKDFLNPEKAAIGTTAVLAVRYNEQLNPTQKKNLYKELPKKWNTRGNYVDRVNANLKNLDLFEKNINKFKNGGSMSNTNQNEQQQQMMQAVSQMLQQLPPEQVVQKLVENEVPEDQANQLVQQVMQMSEGQASQQGGQEQQMQQIMDAVQQMMQQGAQPTDVAAELLTNGVPPEVVMQAFVQMGIPEQDAQMAIEQSMQAVQQNQAPAVEQTEGVVDQNAQDVEEVQPEQMAFGGIFRGKKNKRNTIINNNYYAYDPNNQMGYMEGNDNTNSAFVEPEYNGVDFVKNINSSSNTEGFPRFSDGEFTSEGYTPPATFQDGGAVDPNEELQAVMQQIQELMNQGADIQQVMEQIQAATEQGQISPDVANAVMQQLQQSGSSQQNMPQWQDPAQQMMKFGGNMRKLLKKAYGGETEISATNSKDYVAERAKRFTGALKGNVYSSMLDEEFPSLSGNQMAYGGSIPKAVDGISIKDGKLTVDPTKFKSEAEYKAAVLDWNMDPANKDNQVTVDILKTNTWKSPEPTYEAGKNYQYDPSTKQFKAVAATNQNSNIISYGWNGQPIYGNQNQTGYGYQQPVAYNNPGGFYNNLYASSSPLGRLLLNSGRRNVAPTITGTNLPEGTTAEELLRLVSSGALTGKVGDVTWNVANLEKYKEGPLFRRKKGYRVNFNYTNEADIKKQEEAAKRQRDLQDEWDMNQEARNMRNLQDEWDMKQEQILENERYLQGLQFSPSSQIDAKNEIYNSSIDNNVYDISQTDMTDAIDIDRSPAIKLDPNTNPNVNSNYSDQDIIDATISSNGPLNDQQLAMQKVLMQNKNIANEYTPQQLSYIASAINQGPRGKYLYIPSTGEKKLIENYSPEELQRQATEKLNNVDTVSDNVRKMQYAANPQMFQEGVSTEPYVDPATLEGNPKGFRDFNFDQTLKDIQDAGKGTAYGELQDYRRNQAWKNQGVRSNFWGNKQKLPDGTLVEYDENQQMYVPVKAFGGSVNLPLARWGKRIKDYSEFNTNEYGAPDTSDTKFIPFSDEYLENEFTTNDYGTPDETGKFSKTGNINVDQNEKFKIDWDAAADLFLTGAPRVTKWANQIRDYNPERDKARFSALNTQRDPYDTMDQGLYDQQGNWIPNKYNNQNLNPTDVYYNNQRPIISKYGGRIFQLGGEIDLDDNDLEELRRAGFNFTKI